jgi:hypothetical protein
MKRTICKGLALLAIVAVFASPAARAACTFDSQPVTFALGGVINNCPDGQPVLAQVYLMSNPALANSNGLPIVCRTDTEILPQAPDRECIFSPGGILGDGIVSINLEFGVGTNTVGCPAPTGTVNGAAPIITQVTCNNGAGVMIATGFDADTGFYTLENSSTQGGNFTASFENGPTITSVNAGPSPSAANVCVNVPVPHVFSDCDIAGQFTCPSPGARPAVARGQLFTRTAPCIDQHAQPGVGAGGPDARLRTCAQGGGSCTVDADCVAPSAPPCGDRWTLLPNQPGPTGDACNIIQQPTVAGQCAFVGTTANFGANGSGNVVGWLQVNTQGAATDKVKIDRAAFDGGKVVVNFSTSNETSIVGFNVYSGSLKLNGNLISAKGTGSNPYAFEIGRGALKGGKTVEVEAVKSDNSVVKTGPVSLK